MPVDVFEPEGDEVCVQNLVDSGEVEIDVEVLEDDIDIGEIDVVVLEVNADVDGMGVLKIDVDVDDMGVVVNEVLADVASIYGCFDCIHDESFLILFFLAIVRFGPTIPWGVVPGVVGDVVAADERLVEDEFRLAEVFAVEVVEDFEDFELDPWQSLSSPPHVEDPISVVASRDSSLLFAGCVWCSASRRGLSSAVRCPMSVGSCQTTRGAAGAMSLMKFFSPASRRGLSSSPVRCPAPTNCGFTAGPLLPRGAGGISITLSSLLSSGKRSVLSSSSDGLGSFPKLHNAHPSMPNDVLRIVSIGVCSNVSPVVMNACAS